MHEKTQIVRNLSSNVFFMENQKQLLLGRSSPLFQLLIRTTLQDRFVRKKSKKKIPMWSGPKYNTHVLDSPVHIPCLPPDWSSAVDAYGDAVAVVVGSGLYSFWICCFYPQTFKKCKIKYLFSVKLWYVISRGSPTII